ncbi:hypothetical protein HAX54_048271, partial [Datura stramonium]|nr:hypothetical protein [Datura stramonium]
WCHSIDSLRKLGLITNVDDDFDQGRYERSIGLGTSCFPACPRERNKNSKGTTLEVVVVKDDNEESKWNKSLVGETKFFELDTTFDTLSANDFIVPKGSSNFKALEGTWNHDSVDYLEMFGGSPCEQVMQETIGVTEIDATFGSLYGKSNVHRV